MNKKGTNKLDRKMGDMKWAFGWRGFISSARVQVFWSMIGGE
jgi:hypothetical protein